MTDATFESRAIGPDGLEQMEKTISAASALLAIINDSAPSRERSLAITKLEECVMWANKGISRE